LNKVFVEFMLKLITALMLIPHCTYAKKSIIKILLQQTNKKFF